MVTVFIHLYWHDYKLVTFLLAELSTARSDEVTIFLLLTEIYALVIKEAANAAYYYYYYHHYYYYYLHKLKMNHRQQQII